MSEEPLHPCTGVETFDRRLPPEDTQVAGSLRDCEALGQLGQDEPASG